MNKPGLTASSRNRETPEKVFSLFFDDFMVAGDTALTNMKINETLEAAQLADTPIYPE